VFLRPHVFIRPIFISLSIPQLKSQKGIEKGERKRGGDVLPSPLNPKNLLIDMGHDARAFDGAVHGFEHVSAADEHGAHCTEGAEDVLVRLLAGVG